MQRKAEVKRKTKETDIRVVLNIDGSGKAKIGTGIGLLDHMLELFAFHGLFDLEIAAKGDLKVDIHHTNEDIGIVMGDAFKKAVGDKEGIRRFGSSSVPMEEVTASVTLDVSGRGSFQLYPKEMFMSGECRPEAEAGYELKDVAHFFDAFAKRAGVNVNIKVEPISRDMHTTLEPIFKAFGIALDQATQVDPRRKGVPSTKGVID